MRTGRFAGKFGSANAPYGPLGRTVGCRSKAGNGGEKAENRALGLRHGNDPLPFSFVVPCRVSPYVDGFGHPRFLVPPGCRLDLAFVPY